MFLATKDLRPSHGHPELGQSSGLTVRAALTLRAALTRSGPLSPIDNYAITLIFRTSWRSTVAPLHEPVGRQEPEGVAPVDQAVSPGVVRLDGESS